MGAIDKGLLGRFRQAPRIIRIGVYFLLLYLVYALIVGGIVPKILQSKAPKMLGTMLGRQITLTDIHINPFLLRMRVDGFAIKEVQSQESFFNMASLELEISFWRSLLTMSPQIDHLWLEQPNLQLVRLNSSEEETRFNFSDLMSRFQSMGDAPATSPATSPSPESLPSIRVRDLQVNKGQVRFEDREVGTHLSQGLTFAIKDIDTQALLTAVNQKGRGWASMGGNRFHLSVEDGQKGQYQIEGQFQLMPLDIRGELTLKNINLMQSAPYLASLTQATLTDGVLDFSGQFHLWQGPKGIEYALKRGELSLKKLAFGLDLQPSVKLGKLNLGGIDIRSDQRQITLGQLQVDGLWADADLNANGLDLASLIPETAQTIGDDSKSNTPLKIPIQSVSKPTPWQVSLAGVNIQGADLSLHDRLLSDGQHWRIYPVNFSAGAIKVNSKSAIDYKLELGITLDDKALSASEPLQLSSQGQVVLDALDVNGALKINNLDLPQFKAYLTKVTAGKLTQGELDFAGQFHLWRSAQGIDYSLQQGVLSLNKLSIALHDEPRVKVKQLTLNGMMLNSQQRQIALGKLQLAGVWVGAELNAQGLDLSALQSTVEATKGAPRGQVAKKTPKGASESKSKLWQISLTGVDMQDGDLNLRDELLGNGLQWRLYPVDFSTGPIQLNSKAAIDYKLLLGITSGNTASKPAPEQLVSQGQILPGSRSAKGSLKLQDLDLRQFQPYLRPHVNLTLAQGKLSFDGSFDEAPEGAPRLVGALVLEDVLLKDGQQKDPLIEFQTLRMKDLHYDGGQKSVSVAVLTLDGPYTRVIITKDKHAKIAQPKMAEPKAKAKGAAAVAANKAEPTQSSTSPSHGFKIAIEHIKIINGSAYFSDQSLTPNFSSSIEFLTGDIKGLNSDPNSFAKVEIDGKIDRYVDVDISGTLNPFRAKPYLDLDLRLKNLGLVDFSSYAALYAGYEIDRGQLSLDLNYKIRDQKLEGQNHLLIDRLEFGKPSGSKLATKLPIELAITLLKDKDGVIDLGVPVTGDLNDPKFSFGDALQSTFSNLITKTVGAPFSWLASLFERKNRMDQLDFVPGEFKLSPKDQQKLLLLAKALQQRPELQLVISPGFAAREDSRAVAEKEMQQFLLQKSGLSALPAQFDIDHIPQRGPMVDALLYYYQVWRGWSAEDKRKEIAEQLKEQSAEGNVTEQQIDAKWHMALYERLLKTWEVPQIMINELAKARAAAVMDYLKIQGRVDSKRLVLSKTMASSKSMARVLLELRPR